MANFFYDTEFLEGTQKTLFGKTKATIDLISIGIVDGSGREYYAISKDFNLKEAWNRYDLKYIRGCGDMNNLPPTKVYWIRDNILLSIYNELIVEWNKYMDKAYGIGVSVQKRGIYTFNYKNLKFLISMFGKSNDLIRDEIMTFIGSELTVSNWVEICRTNPIKLYGYYSAYDHVVFCWLFGKMMALPNGYPMYTTDLKQIMDAKGFTNEWKERNCPEPEIKHHALEDAKWNLKLYRKICN